MSETSKTTMVEITIPGTTLPYKARTDSVATCEATVLNGHSPYKARYPALTFSVRGQCNTQLVSQNNIQLIAMYLKQQFLKGKSV